MKKKNKEKTTANDMYLLPIKFVIDIIMFFIHLVMYITLGSYYFVNFVIVKPLSFLGKGLSNLYYALFTPRSVKKEKELKLTINYDSDGDADTGNKPKSINAQMEENMKKFKEKKKASKISPRQQKKLDAERKALLKLLNDGADKRLEKPQAFRYKALNSEGKLEVNTFMGVSKLDIFTFLTGEGYTVMSIETSDLINFVYGESVNIYHKLSTKDLIFFITQLATYIKAGITLTEAVRILSKQIKNNKSEKKIMQSVVYYLTMGESFSSALEHQNGAFPQLVINMIKAAEAAGNLEETLDDLGQYYTEINSTRKEMISALSYPALVLCFSIIVIVFIMLKIVPQFVDIYASAGANLNPLTTFVIWLSTFLQQYIFLILLLIGIAIFIIIMAYKNVTTFRRSIQTLIMKIPVFGKIIIYNELTIFTKTFASLLKNDVFITDSISILSKLTNNEIYKEIMVNTISNIAKGEKISDSFKDNWAVPDIAYYMIVTGENTGQLAQMMKKVSDYYQEQHRTMVNSMKTLIEPIMIIFLAVVVGGVMIAVIMPMFSLYGEIA